MGHPKITIGPGDYLAWGKLVKTWASGKNYVDHEITDESPIPTEEAPKYPKPRSFAEFWDQCFSAHVGLVFDDGLNTPVPRDDVMGLIVLQGDSDVFVLRLPPQEILAKAETKFIASDAYALPHFYERIFGDPKPGSQDSPAKRMTLHAERIGEYTLNTCG